MVKVLTNILMAECFICCVVGLWIHEIPLILAGLFCLAISPLLKKDLVV